MPTIHPTAILEGDIDLADDVVIGPNCVLTGAAGPVKVGAGSTLIGNVYLHGPLTMGSGNVVYPFACLGFAPQHVKYDPRKPGMGLSIGDGNTFREGVTIHRAFVEDRPTIIGSRNYFMAGSHAGHDCRVGDDCTFVNNALLGGHVEVGDKVTIGGVTGVHQFVRIGRGAMLSGGVGTTLDVPPFFMLTEINRIGGLNIVGLRRGGFSHDQIDDARWVFRMLYRQGMTVRSALNVLRERAERPMIAEYIAFIEASKRGICTARGRRRSVMAREDEV